MDIKKEFATDVKAEEDGVWMDDLSGDCKFLIARIGNPNYTKYLNELMRPHRRAMRRGLFSDEAQDKVLIKAMARTILLNWEGLQEGGVDVKYSEEITIRLLTDYKDFREMITEMATEIEKFRIQDTEEAEKN